jgi:hypothetical protein
LLRAHLHHALVPAGHLEHPAALPREQRQGFLHIHVLAGGTGHHRHQRVPMIRRGHHHRLDFLVLEQPPKVAILRDLAPDQLGGRLEPGLVGLGDRHDLCIGLRLEVPGVNAPDQPIPDDAHTDSLVRPQDAVPRGGGQGRGGAGSDEVPPGQSPADGRPGFMRVGGHDKASFEPWRTVARRDARPRQACAIAMDW